MVKLQHQTRIEKQVGQRGYRLSMVKLQPAECQDRRALVSGYRLSMVKLQQALIQLKLAKPYELPLEHGEVATQFQLKGYAVVV